MCIMYGGEPSIYDLIVTEFMLEYFHLIRQGTLDFPYKLAVLRRINIFFDNIKNCQFGKWPVNWDALTFVWRHRRV